MRELAEHTYFVLCRTLGRLLRAWTYAAVRIVRQDGELEVQKRRSFYAPLLIWLGDLIVRLLATGVRVLPQQQWQEREGQIYQRLYGTSVRIDADGTLVLPRLAGETLATLLENPTLDEIARARAIGLAVVALVAFHARGFTHADAMAENVMVDLETGVARWFDFETVHDESRLTTWRRADDVRALLATCLLRSAPEKVAETLKRIVDAYADDDVTRAAAKSFTSVWRRALPFHLGQAGLSFRRFNEIGRGFCDRFSDRQK